MGISVLKAWREKKQVGSFFLPPPAQNRRRTGRMVVSKNNFFERVELSHD